MKIAEKISWKLLQDKVVAVNITTGVYYTMNSVASEIWQAIEVGKDDDQIVEQLGASYPDIDKDTLRNDYVEQVNYWVSEQLLIH